MQPITFKCFACGKVLGADRYPINPYTGKRFKDKALCVPCFEDHLRRATRGAVEEQSELAEAKRKRVRPEESHW